MQNRPQVDNHVTNVGQVASNAPPIPTDYGPTVASVSVVLSLLAIVISISTAAYSRRSDRRSGFDADFGSPLRASLRELDQSADELKAFIFPSAKLIDNLKDELQTTQSRIEEKALAVSRLIREIDTSTTVSRSGWEKKFSAQAEAAGNRLETMYNPNMTNIATFQARAEQAQADYRKLVADTRKEIDEVRRGCLKDRT